MIEHTVDQQRLQSVTTRPIWDGDLWILGNGSRPANTIFPVRLDGKNFLQHRREQLGCFRQKDLGGHRAATPQIRKVLDHLIPDRMGRIWKILYQDRGVSNRSFSLQGNTIRFKFFVANMQSEERPSGSPNILVPFHSIFIFHPKSEIWFHRILWFFRTSFHSEIILHVKTSW